MKRKIQFLLTDESWDILERLKREANEGFEVGSISYSDLLNEIVLTTKVDFKALQLKHTDIRKSLRSMAAKDTVDIDAIIKSLNELKAKSKSRRASNESEDSQ
jgi:hypothetical protein